MIFILQFHNIYCLSFHLKHEGMNYIVDNFKSSRIIGVTNLMVEKISNILVCPKKCLSKCRDMLRLTYEDLRGPTLRIASQVQDSWASFRKNFFLEDMYDEGVPYISPLEAWINEACQSNDSLWHRSQVFQVLKKVRFPALTKINILVQTQHIINEVLSWITLKDKGNISCMNCLLRWLHWWYDFT